MGKLADTTLRKLKPDHPKTKLFDGDGLFLDVKPPGPRSPSGSKTWRLKYYFMGTEKSLTLGSYPDVSLKFARELKAKNKALLAGGTDPSAHRQAQKIAHRSSRENSFEAIAREWFELYGGRLRSSTREKAEALMEKWVYPVIGPKAITELKQKDFFDNVFKRIIREGKIETAQRVKQRCARILMYAEDSGRLVGGPRLSLGEDAKAPPVRNHSAITDPSELALLMKAIDGFKGQQVTQCALKLSPLLFVRPGELRRAEWSEIDFEKSLWTIPAEKMKMNKAHLVPLSKQALEIFQDLRRWSGAGKYCFPGSHDRERPMSENTVNGALRRLSYTGDEIVAHGFRSTASTNLNEQGWRYDVIERQLAHVERNDSRRPYNKAEYLKERTAMMQAWADFLDALRESQDTAGVSAAITGLFRAGKEANTPRTT